MPMYTSAYPNLTPVAAAQGSTLLTSNGYLGVRTTAATNAIRLVEVFIGGEATSSTVNRMALRRHSSNSATPAAGAGQVNTTPSPISPWSVASTHATFGAATTNPTTANLNALHVMSFNPFGGVIRWVAAPGEEVWVATNTANNSEVSVTSMSGTGLVSVSVIAEEM